MTLVRNPFDAGGYSLAEMTQAINILPNLYTRLAQIGLFRFEGVSQRSVIQVVLNRVKHPAFSGCVAAGPCARRKPRCDADL